MNYVDRMDRPAPTQTGVTVSPSCMIPAWDGTRYVPCWVVRVEGRMVFHGPEAEALHWHGVEVRRARVAVSVA